MCINYNNMIDNELIKEELLVDRNLSKVLTPKIAVFGSARLKASSSYYNAALAFAKAAASEGFLIMTGGGPGIMEAANKGAKDAGSPTSGFCVDIPGEPNNSFLSREYTYNYKCFFIRKYKLIINSSAYFFFPGGLGTLDELFEVFLQKQLNRSFNPPIYLIGSSFWEGLISWIKIKLIEIETISKEDLAIIKISDDPVGLVGELKEYFKDSYKEKCLND